MNVVAIVAIFFLALIGVPLFIIMAFLALTLFSFSGVDTSAVAVEIYRLASAPTLLTIPLFTFAGHVLAASKAPKRLLQLTDAIMGWMPGGVAIVSLVICAFFTAFTGASGVTIIALGGLIYPILKNEGYTENFTLGLITTSGSLGLLFPPSLPIILYGLVAKIDIDKLFLAGIVPGLLLLFVLSLFAVKNGKTSKDRKAFSFLELKTSLKSSALEAMLPILVLVGIYSGFTTVTEAAAVMCFFVIVIECFIYKDVSFFRDLPTIVVDSMSLVGGILLILCCAMGLTNYLIDEEVPLMIFDLMKGFLGNKYTFLLFLNVFLLVVGSLMDIFSAIIVVVPFILPIAEQFAIHPIHLAIIFLTNLEIGYITPPIGINLFISSFKFKKPVVELYRASFPFLILMVFVLLIITYIPQLTLVFLE